MLVYVQDNDGTPLMPTQRVGWVRRALRDGKAVVVSRSPITIRLTYESTGHVQPVTVGVDTGFSEVGVSAVAEGRELFSGRLTLLKGTSARLTERRRYRRVRRNRLRHRKPRWLKDTKTTGWLPPSLHHKLDSHIRLIGRLKTLLPVSQVIVEVGAFDPHKLKNPEVAGVGYQRGEQFGFDNLREFILHRDGHRCQNPACQNKTPHPILQVHHIGYWKHDTSDRPGNLVTLCTGCHTPSNHQRSGALWGWHPQLPTLRAATFMSILRERLARETGATKTFGYITKAVRRQARLDKSHENDAFVIAGGGATEARADLYTVEQRRRNNRSLERFYDAQYIDLRDGKKKPGKVLSSQRRKRRREHLPPSLRVFRAHKVTPGRKAIRRVHHKIQPGDLLRVGKAVVLASGTHCQGARVMLSTGQSISVKKAEVIRFGKGLSFHLTRRPAIPPLPGESQGGGILAGL